MPLQSFVRSVIIAGCVVGLGLSPVLVPSAANALSPHAVDDSYSVPAGALFSPAPGEGLLANDLDLASVPGTVVSLESPPAHGDLTSIALDGRFSYQPDAGFVGTDSFVYCLSAALVDPCGGTTATVTLAVQSTIERLAGPDRYAGSAVVSAAKFPAELDTAYVASGEVFADALSASAAAGAEHAPVLLVQRDAVPTAVATELRRLQPKRIVLVGGPASVSVAVETALGAFSDNVIRIAGADRYAVSAAASARVFAPVGVAYVASGETFPDALSGAAAAGALGGPVLLVQKNAMSAAVEAELRRLQPVSIVVLGGEDTVAESVRTTLRTIASVTRVSGADRYSTAAQVSSTVFSAPKASTVYVASGEVFPDALAGSAAAIENDGPVLLVSRDSVPAATATELDRLSPTRIVVLGGTNTVSAATYAALATHLHP